MKYRKPKIYRLFPSKIDISACMDGEQASSMACVSGPEASSGCKTGAAAGTACKDGSAAGFSCNSGAGFEEWERK